MMRIDRLLLKAAELREVILEVQVIDLVKI